MSADVSLDFDRRPRAVTYMLRGILPVRRRVDLVPHIRAQWHRHRVDAAELATFRRITGLPSGPELPLLYPHTFGFRLTMAVLTHTAFPVPIWGVLQTRNHIVQYRPIRVDEILDFDACVLRGRAVPKGAEFDLQTTVHVAGELAWQSDIVFFTRGRFGDPLSAAPPVAPPTDTGVCVAEWSMRDADHRTFCDFTGDYNGIHLWDAYARRFGFRHALYHPPRVLGECMARLQSCEGGAAPTRLDAWLKGPVSHGSKVRLHAMTNAGDTNFALFAGDTRPCIVGRLQG